jgi:hypothetical protein
LRFSFHADSGVIVAAIAEQLRGVGHVCGDNPDSVPLMVCSNIGSAHNSPFRVIP